MKNAYASYYQHLIKLKEVANGRTMFLSHILTMMTYDGPSKQNIISLNSFTKKKIIKEIGSNTANPLKMADKYLNVLKEAGIITALGGGSWAVDPECYGYATTISKVKRAEAKAIYCSYEFTDEGVKMVKGIIDEDDNMIPIGED